MEQEIKAGSYVTYTAQHGKQEKGIVKSITEDGQAAFVVYHCNDDWENYYNYTGARTELTNLHYGWTVN